MNPVLLSPCDSNVFSSLNRVLITNPNLRPGLSSRLLRWCRATSPWQTAERTGTWSVRTCVAVLLCPHCRPSFPPCTSPGSWQEASGCVNPAPPYLGCQMTVPINLMSLNWKHKASSRLCSILYWIMFCSYFTESLHSRGRNAWQRHFKLRTKIWLFLCDLKKKIKYLNISNLHLHLLEL